MNKKAVYIFVWTMIIAFFTVLWTEKCVTKTRQKGIDLSFISTSHFREQKLDEDFFSEIIKKKLPGEDVAIHLLNATYGTRNWKKQSGWIEYKEAVNAIWNDVKYFPIPEFTNTKNIGVTYENSWMNERTYGGERGHEGTDIIASKNVRGLYPIISMTDGIVDKMGWLEKGGYRIGIKTEKGAYFYYAHLDSYSNVKVGDEIKAGDVLGYMGDSGYGSEGTVGKFVVHLHLGIYIYPDGVETSINPYWVLRYIEKNKVKCYTEK